MPLSRWAQRSARVVALGAAAPGLGPRTAPRTSPPAPGGADDVALALRAAAVGAIDTTAINAINPASAVGRLTAEGARPAGPERIAADPSPAVPRP